MTREMFIDVNSDEWVCNGYAHFNESEYNKKSGKPCYISENGDETSYKEMHEETIEFLKQEGTKMSFADAYEKPYEELKDLSIDDFYKAINGDGFKVVATQIIEDFIGGFDDGAWSSYSTYLVGLYY